MSQDNGKRSVCAHSSHYKTNNDVDFVFKKKCSLLGDCSNHRQRHKESKTVIVMDKNVAKIEGKFPNASSSTRPLLECEESNRDRKVQL